ncbi:MAG: chorismate-binding protein [Anaerovoracaceae bacterium]
MEITCLDDVVTVRETMPDGSEKKETVTVSHPGDVLRKILADYRTPAMEDMPSFTGGLVGYFSYDYIKYSEPKLKPLMSSRPDEDENQEFRDMDLMLFDKVIAFDHYRQKLLLIAGVSTDDIEKSYEEAEQILEDMAQLIKHGEKEDFRPLQLKSEIKTLFSEEQYCSMVEKAKQYIHEGDIFQVVLSNPMRAEAEGSLFDTYRVLRTENPSPYMFYFSSDDIELSGASPETLAKLQDGRISTFPLAGTRVRGRNDEEDKALKLNFSVTEKGAGGAQHAGGSWQERHRQSQRTGHSESRGIPFHRKILPRNAHRLHSDRKTQQRQGCSGMSGRNTSGRHAFRSA